MDPKERHRLKMQCKRSLASCINRLLELCRVAVEPPDSPDRAVFLSLDGYPTPEAIELGRALHRIGGTDAMQSAILAIPAYDRKELDFAWNGIGTAPDIWRC